MSERVSYMTNENEPEKKVSYEWMLCFVVVLFVLVISTVVVVGVAVSQYGDSLPQNIDVVIVERDRGITLSQVTSIDQNMNFRRNIYIQTANHANGPANFIGINNVYYINFTPIDPQSAEVLNEYFLAMNSIRNLTDVPDITDHAMFLADQTIPFRFIQKTHLFYGHRPRVFNIFRDKSETDFLQVYFNYTCPCFVVETTLFDQLPNPQTIQDFVLFSISQQRLTLRNDFNRDVFVNADNSALTLNFTKQFSELVTCNPLFATFHVTGTQTTIANQALAAFLLAQFVV